MWCSTPLRADRRQSLRWLAALGLGLGAALPAAAQTGHPQLAGARLQGEATMRFFGMRVYNARLWAAPDFRADQPVGQALVLELEYLLSLKGQAIAERSLQEMRRAGGFSEAQAQRWLEQMRALFPDVRPGDRLSGLLEPGVAASFWLNGKALGRVEDGDFARLFFGIWLAPTTSEPAMRLALLGQALTTQR